MKFYSKYCKNCKSKRLFLEKLKNPKDPYGTKMEDVCQTCKKEG